MTGIVSATSLGLLVAWFLLRQRRLERLRSRLMPAAPPEPPRMATQEEIGPSAVELTDAAGLTTLGRIYAPLLSRAGVYSPWAGSLYTAAKMASVCILFLTWMWLSDPSTWSGSNLGFFAGSILATGFLPDLFLWAHIRERRAKLQLGLPDWLDLHTTLVEGGMSFDAALARIVTETEGTKEPIFKEIGMVHREILMGTSRATALRRMADRTRVDEIDQVVTALVNADRLGAGIVNALRPQADMIRNRIWEEARTRAERLGTKLLFPIFVGSLPVFFVLIVLPLILRLIATIKGIQR